MLGKILTLGDIAGKQGFARQIREALLAFAADISARRPDED
ncbi:MAG TPA: hypothetical protein VJ998_12010 [Pseudomonadales bacterium]|nr:hypothetical protein [Pseudomonadales bacterium]